MKNRFFLLLVTIFIFSKIPSQQRKVELVEDLKVAFNKNSEKEFLENFPTDFITFKSTFGWNDTTDNPSPLYKEANKYIDYWFTLIEKSKYKTYEKAIIAISAEGISEADAVSYFKNKSFNYISKNNYSIVNNLSDSQAKLVFTFLFNSQNINSIRDFTKNLNSQKRKIANEIINTEKSKQTTRNNLEHYLNNSKYFIKNLDINKDGSLDKIVSSKPYERDELFVFLNDKKGRFILSLETVNFSADGGNIIKDILPIANSKGFTIVTDFPDRGYYEIEYQIVMSNNSWILKNITYKTMSDNSENAVKYICEVPQNIDITKSGWTDKIFPIPDEKSRNKKCRVEKAISTKYYSIQDPDGYINLRKDKNASSKIVQKIKTGEKIEILDKNGD